LFDADGFCIDANEEKEKYISIFSAGKKNEKQIRTIRPFSIM
jgi:hypothetical protein